MRDARMIRRTVTELRLEIPVDSVGKPGIFRYDGKVLYWYTDKGVDSLTVSENPGRPTYVIEIELDCLIDYAYVRALQEFLGVSLFPLLMSGLATRLNEQIDFKVTNDKVAALMERGQAKAVFERPVS